MANKNVPAKGLSLGAFDQSITRVKKAFGVLGVLSQCDSIGDVEANAAWAASDLAGEALLTLKGLEKKGAIFLLAEHEKDKLLERLHQAAGVTRALHEALGPDNLASAAWAADDLLTEAASTIDEGMANV